jgi:hypothetical protein
MDALPKHNQQSHPKTTVATLCLGMVIAACLLSSGCSTTRSQTFSSERPQSHTWATEHFVVHSDDPLLPGNPLIQELQEVRTRLLSLLELPEQRDLVHVYLFNDEASYRWYMQSTWRDLPPRRAYFVGTTRELAVYSFRGQHAAEDLRHEFSHGLLHASLQTVPLWLDEGLAEYFEISSDSENQLSPAHLQELSQARTEGWNPGLFRLEQITDFRALSQRDYAESWAWVHFLLHATPASRQVLLDYLQTLASTRTPGKLLNKLEAAIPSWALDFENYTDQLIASAPFSAGESSNRRNTAGP